MAYLRLNYEDLKTFCEKVYAGYGFTEEESRIITEVLLAADLYGIESHGVQRLIRYHKEITDGMVKMDAKPEIVRETPLSAVIEGNDAMGQVLAKRAMQMAIEKAKAHGIGMIAVLDESEAQQAIDILGACGEKASVIGKVTDVPGVNIIMK